MSATPEEAFAPIVEELRDEPGVEEGTGFGSNPGLTVGGRIFAMVIRGELVVKLPAERCDELVASGAARPFESGKRRMREWVALAGTPDRERWCALAGEARSFVRG